MQWTPLTMVPMESQKNVEVGRQSLYPEEFRKDAVALYRAADGKRTYAAVAADLGITVARRYGRGFARTPPVTGRRRTAVPAPTGPSRTSSRGCARRMLGCGVRRRNGSSNARFCAGHAGTERIRDHIRRPDHPESELNRCARDTGLTGWKRPTQPGCPTGAASTEYREDNDGARHPQGNSREKETKWSYSCSG